MVAVRTHAHSGERCGFLDLCDRSLCLEGDETSFKGESDREPGHGACDRHGDVCTPGPVRVRGLGTDGR